MKHKIIKNAIPQVLCEYLAIEFKLIHDNIIRLNGAPSDPAVPGAFAMYSPICFETLSLFLQKTVETTVHKELYPSYTYSRIYKNNCELKRHKDRKSSEYSVSCCITKDVNWPLFFEYDDGIIPVELEVGDIVIFQGHEYFHWREPYKGTEQIIAFLQYVDSHGSFSHYKYDGRPMLGAEFESAHPDIHKETEFLNNGYIE